MSEATERGAVPEETRNPLELGRLLATWLEDDLRIHYFEPLIRENTALTAEVATLKTRAEAAEARVARLEAPVSEREWADAQTLARSIYMSDAERATQIIKDRAHSQQPAPAKEQPTASCADLDMRDYHGRRD